MSANMPGDGKRAFVVRLGAIGDMVLIGPVLQQLKADGYHVTLLCKEWGRVIFKGSGVVDVFQEWADADEAWVQTRAKEPGCNLFDAVQERCGELAKPFDRVVNLNGVIEGHFMHRVMDIPDEDLNQFAEARAAWEKWGHGKWELGHYEHRHENHTDWVMHVAGYDGPEYEGRKPVYVVTPEERHWVHKLFKKHRVTDKNFKVVIQLSGSGIAKTWPYTPDLAVALSRKFPFIRIFTIGVGADEMLEWYWSEDMPTVIPLAGRAPQKADGSYDISPLEIRRFAALIEQSDLYIGPDTSFLHIAGAFETPKIALYSVTHHSNIGKYYPNTSPIHPPVKCHPCGKITVDCHRGPRGSSLCMESIKPEWVYRLTAEEVFKWGYRKGLLRKREAAPVASPQPEAVPCPC